MPPRPFAAPTARALVALVLCLGALSRPVRAQDDDSDGALPGAVDLYLGVTELAQVAAGEAGFGASIDLGGGLRIGGAAWSILRRIDEGPVMEDSGLALGLGYGGGFAEMALGALPLSARLLIGGGAATLRTVAVGTRYDTETFVVVEPGLVGTVRVAGPVALGGMAGFRWIHGADSLLLVGPESLNGFRGALFLRLGG